MKSLRCALVLCVVALGTACATPTMASPTLATLTVTPRGGGLQWQMQATAHFSDGSTQDVTSVATWQSSNPSAGTISPAGVLSILASGPTLITATYQGKVASASLFLLPPCAAVGGC
jgi:hypothetical protein